MNSFVSLYEEYLPKIYRYMYNRTLHKQTSEDLTSTVFMKAVAKMQTYNQDQNFGPWIYAIARNTLIDHYRTHKESLDLNVVVNLASKVNIESQTDSSIKLEEVVKAIHGLSEAQREVLILRVWDDLSHKEIAEILNISEANSKMTLSRAVDALKTTLNYEETN